MRPPDRATSSRPAWPPATALNLPTFSHSRQPPARLAECLSAQPLWRWARQPLRAPRAMAGTLQRPSRVADGYCVDIPCPPSDARRCRSTVTSAMRSRVGAEYRRRVHPALRARIRRWRTPAPPRPRTTRDCGGHQLSGRPHEVRSCLDSVVRSSYRNIEILVLIDGASRSIAAVLRSYARWDPRIKIVDQPMGSASTRDQRAERPLPHGARSS